MADAQTVAVLSFDIDDMTGEEIGIAADRLRAADGVLDVALATLSGKKGRPLVEFRLLIRPESLSAIQQLCFVETSTIGLRWRIEQRATLDRSADTDASAIRIKRVNRPDGATTAKAESDDLTAIDTPGPPPRREGGGRAMTHAALRNKADRALWPLPRTGDRRLRRRGQHDAGLYRAPVLPRGSQHAARRLARRAAACRQPVSAPMPTARAGR